MELSRKHLEASSSYFLVYIELIVLLSCIHLRGLNMFDLAKAALAVRGNDTDQQALLQFKAKITGDELRVMESWNSSIHFCQWHGVTCGRKHQRVTKLELQYLKLLGSLSPYIGNLSFLKELNLVGNNFYNQIPQEIGYLRRLEILELINNSISDETVPNGGTPHHSSNVDGADNTQGSHSMASQPVHCFTKHDTIKLGEHNFLLWKRQILLILEGYDLDGFVLGTTPIPPTHISNSDGQYVDNPSFRLHKKQDKFLASRLISTVTTEVLEHLPTAKTSSDIWSSIKRRFGAKSGVKLSSMRPAFYSLKKGSLSIKEYLCWS